MSYVLPQVTVFQEFNATPTATSNSRAAHITGGHAQLFRYSDADEKQVISLGEYDSQADSIYSWPEKPAVSKIDSSYVKLFAEEALLEYYVNNASSGSVVAPVAGHKNRVRDAGTSFKTNGAYLRSADLYDRDVQLGDRVYIRGVVGGEEYSLTSSVRGFVGDTVSAVLGSTVNDAANKATQGSLVVNINTLGLKNCVTVAASGAGYDGRPDGDIDETYTVEVVNSSVGGDFTTAKLRVTTASGNDNQSNVIPEAAGVATEIGSRGLLVTFDINSTGSASSEAEDSVISPIDLVVGQKWSVRVKQIFTAPAATFAGTYTGTKNTRYIVTVTKGGSYASGPEVTVSTTTGYDVSGPTVISASATAFPIGSHGLTVSFNQTALCKNDKYYVDATAAKEGAMKTLVLSDDLPEEMAAATDLDLKLYIVKNLQIEKNLQADAPNTSFTVSDTEFTVNSGILLYDDSWTDSGTLLPLPLKGGSLFVEYRAWLSDYVATLESTNDIGELPALLGQASPDNPLYWGVYMALLNSNGQPVYFSAVSDPEDTDTWISVLELVDGKPEVYNLVPLTTNAVVTSAWKAQALADSSPETAVFKGCFFGIDVPDTKAIIDESVSSDGLTVLAKLADDPNTSGTQYTLLTVPANNAKFVSKGVRAGDKVRFLYSSDGFGNETYSEFTVDSVLSEGSLRLTSGHVAAVTVAQRVEIWRNLNRSDKTLVAIDEIGKYGHTRVVAVANSTVALNGVTFPGYFLGAALAGERSGLLPQQSLTRVTVNGIDDVGDFISSLSGTQLNSIAGAGGWIVVKDTTGAIFTRHAVTSDPTDLNSREECVRVNVDDISKTYKSAFEPLIGKTTVTNSSLARVRNLFNSASVAMQSGEGTQAGPQLIDATLTDVRQHALYKDKVVVEASLTIPYPMNNVELKLVI
jgi:hypothetical protein